LGANCIQLPSANRGNRFPARQLLKFAPWGADFEIKLHECAEIPNCSLCGIWYASREADLNSELAAPRFGERPK
jgi:hypothetical protein